MKVNDSLCVGGVIKYHLAGAHQLVETCVGVCVCMCFTYASYSNSGIQEKKK